MEARSRSLRGNSALFRSGTGREEDVVTACQQIFVRRHFENPKGTFSRCWGLFWGTLVIRCFPLALGKTRSKFKCFYYAKSHQQLCAPIYFF